MYIDWEQELKKNQNALYALQKSLLLDHLKYDANKIARIESGIKKVRKKIGYCKYQISKQKRTRYYQNLAKKNRGNKNQGKLF